MALPIVSLLFGFFYDVEFFFSRRITRPFNHVPHSLYQFFETVTFCYQFIDVHFDYPIACCDQNRTDIGPISRIGRGSPTATQHVERILVGNGRR